MAAQSHPHSIVHAFTDDDLTRNYLQPFFSHSGLEVQYFRMLQKLGSPQENAQHHAVNEYAADYAILVDPYVFTTADIQLETTINWLNSIVANTRSVVGVFSYDRINDPQTSDKSVQLFGYARSLAYQHPHKVRVVILKDVIGSQLLDTNLPLMNAIEEVPQGVVSLPYPDETALEPFCVSTALQSIGEALFGYGSSEGEVIYRGVQSMYAVNLGLKTREIAASQFQINVRKVASDQSRDIVQLPLPEHSHGRRIANHNINDCLQRIIANRLERMKVNRPLVAVSKHFPASPKKNLSLKRNTGKKLRLPSVSKALGSSLAVLAVTVTVCIWPHALFKACTFDTLQPALSTPCRWADKPALRWSEMTSHVLQATTINSLSEWGRELADAAFTQYTSLKDARIERSLLETSDHIALRSLGLEEGSTDKDLKHLISMLNNAHVEYALLELDVLNAKIGEGNEKKDPPLILHSKHIRHKLRRALDYTRVFEAIITKPGQQLWLVALQNDQELRPSGGYISAVAAITLEAGRVINVETKTTSQLDALLNGQVEAPADFAAQLNQDNWYIRDANWSPDFQEAGRQIAWFYQKQTGRLPDGVVGLTLSGLQDLIPDNFTVNQTEYTPANLSEKVFQSGIGETAGSDAMAEVVVALFDQYPHLDVSARQHLIQNLFSGLTGKKILMYAADQSVAGHIAAAGIGGAVDPQTCSDQMVQNCHAGFIYPNEANVGINRVNRYVHRSYVHHIELTEKDIAHRQELFIQNLAPHSNYPSGIYQAYLRWTVPKDAREITVLLNGNRIPTGDWHVGFQGAQKYVGVRVEAKVGESQPIAITYNRPHDLDLTQEAIYVLQLIDQPGTPADSYELHLAVPDSLQLVGEGTDERSLILEGDQTLEFAITPKD